MITLCGTPNKHRLLYPLINKDEINTRYDKIEYYRDKYKNIRKYLTNIIDLDKSLRLLSLSEIEPNKLKTTFASGFESRTLSSDLDQVKFIRQIKDFYKTKGTEESYKILFRALYGQEVNIIKPSEFLSFQAINPISSQFLNHCGESE